LKVSHPQSRANTCFANQSSLTSGFVSSCALEFQIVSLDLGLQHVVIENSSHHSSADVRGCTLRTQGGFEIPFRIALPIAPGGTLGIWAGRDGLINSKRDTAHSICFTDAMVWNPEGGQRMHAPRAHPDRPQH
jgi:hypothetical protein